MLDNRCRQINVWSIKSVLWRESCSGVLIAHLFWWVINNETLTSQSRPLFGGYLLFPKKVDIGLGQPWTAFSGRCPGVDTLCKAVDKRLACTATRFPPTPECSHINNISLFYLIESIIIATICVHISLVVSVLDCQSEGGCSYAHQPDICFEISGSLASLSQLSYSEYHNGTLLVEAKVAREIGGHPLSFAKTKQMNR